LIGQGYKLADFGAVGTLAEGTGLTEAGVIAGTPLYMSPEQVTGRQQSSASDLFGLGLLLYRCLYGSLPGEGAGNYLELAASRLQPIPVPPSPLQALLQRLLALDPARRPQSASEVLVALDSILGASRAEPPIAPVPVPAQMPVLEPPSALERELPWPPWERPAVLSIGLTVLAAVLAAVWLGVGGLPSTDWGLVRAVAGLVVVGLAFAGARWIRRRWTSRAPETELRAANLIFGAHQREELTASLIIEVEEVVRNLNTLDAKILGMTVVAMLHQYEDAKKWSHKQKALLDMVTLMEKLQQHLSPWHVRHKDAIATAVAVVGALTGVAGVGERLSRMTTATSR
jgi:hypothetical protein